MPTLTKYDERLTVPVARDTADRLRGIARRRELSLSALIREAIRGLLAEEAGQRERKGTPP